MQKLVFLISLIFVAAAQAQTITHNHTNVFPGETWAKAKPEELGWSTEKLGEAKKLFDTFPSANLVVVERGRVVVEWGDPTFMRSVRLENSRS